MPDDDVLRARVEIDTSGLQRLTSGVESADQSIQRLNASFIEQGLTAEEARSALINLGESASAVDKALGNVAVSSGRATVGISGLERSMETAASRILVTEAGLGRMGLSLTRVGIAAGVMGPLLSAAFPVLAVIGIASLLDDVAGKIEKVRDRVLDQEVSWNRVDHTIIEYNSHLQKSITEADDKISHFTKIGLGEFDDEIKQITIDTDSLFSHMTGTLGAFEAELDKNKKGLWANIITGQGFGGVEEVVSKAKEANAKIGAALNAGDTAGAQSVVAKTLQEIADREAELKKQSGIGGGGTVDKVKAYEDLTAILKSYNDTFSKTLELQKAQQAAEAAEKGAAFSKKMRTEDAEADRKAAQEELEGITRNSEESRKLHEEGMRDSKEMASEELESIARVAEAKKKAASEEESLRLTALESTRKQSESAVRDSEAAAALTISQQEKVGNLGGAGATAASSFSVQQSLLQGLISAESEYQAAVSKSNLEIEKKNELIMQSGKRQTELQDQIVVQFERTTKLEQEISDKDPWKIMQQDLQRTTTLLSAQTSMAQTFTNQLNSGVGSALTNWIVSGKNFGKSMEDTFVHILASEASFVAEWLLKKAELWAMDAIIGKPSQISSAMGSITANAAVAASGAAASVSAIPFVGWAMAPEVAAETFASTMAYASLIAFEKGGIVGRTGPALVHQGEAVLPRNLTQMLQGAAGHGNAGKGITVNYNAHVHAIDTRGVSDMLREHGERFSAHFASEMRRRNV